MLRCFLMSIVVSLLPHVCWFACYAGKRLWLANADSAEVEATLKCLRSDPLQCLALDSSVLGLRAIDPSFLGLIAAFGSAESLRHKHELGLLVQSQACQLEIYELSL